MIKGYWKLIAEDFAPNTDVGEPIRSWVELGGKLYYAYTNASSSFQIRYVDYSTQVTDIILDESDLPSITGYPTNNAYEAAFCRYASKLRIAIKLNDTGVSKIGIYSSIGGSWAEDYTADADYPLEGLWTIINELVGAGEDSLLIYDGVSWVYTTPTIAAPDVSTEPGSGSERGYLILPNLIWNGSGFSSYTPPNYIKRQDRNMVWYGDDNDDSLVSEFYARKVESPSGIIQMTYNGEDDNVIPGDLISIISNVVGKSFFGVMNTYFQGTFIMQYEIDDAYPQRLGHPIPQRTITGAGFVKSTPILVDYAEDKFYAVVENVIDDGSTGSLQYDLYEFIPDPSRAFYFHGENDPTLNEVALDYTDIEHGAMAVSEELVIAISGNKDLDITVLATNDDTEFGDITGAQHPKTGSTRRLQWL